MLPAFPGVGARRVRGGERTEGVPADHRVVAPAQQLDRHSRGAGRDLHPARRQLARLADRAEAGGGDVDEVQDQRGVERQVVVDGPVDDPVQAGRRLDRGQHRQDPERGTPGERRGQQGGQGEGVGGVVGGLSDHVKGRELKLHRVGQVQVDPGVAGRQPVGKLPPAPLEVLAEVPHGGSHGVGPSGSLEAVTRPVEHPPGLAASDIRDDNFQIVGSDVPPLPQGEGQVQPGSALLVDEDRGHQPGRGGTARELALRQVDGGPGLLFLSPQVAELVGHGRPEVLVAGRQRGAAQPGDAGLEVVAPGREDSALVAFGIDDSLGVGALESEEGPFPGLPGLVAGGLGGAGRGGELGVYGRDPLPGLSGLTGFGAHGLLGVLGDVEDRYGDAADRAGPLAAVGTGDRRGQAADEVVPGFAERHVHDVFGERVFRAAHQ